MERITRGTKLKKVKEETITINVEQLERLLKDNEYAKEWKASKYNELIEENIRIKGENRWLREQLEYWNNEYINQDEKAEGYRNKYLKWKRKTKEVREQRKQERRQNKEDKRCFNCNKQGHIARECRCRKTRGENEKVERCNTCGKGSHEQKDCYKNQICEKCNKKGHTEKVCRSNKLERMED